MGVILAMAIHDTPDNNRDVLTEKTLASLSETVDSERHQVFFIVNAATDRTWEAITRYSDHHKCTVTEMPQNVGTAKAINQAWKHRQPGQHCIKMDNDVVIHQNGWIEIMEKCIEADKAIGIVGLKRGDVCQRQDHPDPFYRIHPQTLNNGMTVEMTDDVMGTCTMFSSALLDKIGYLWQPGLYGYDDVFACVRSKIAGFYNCFVPWNYVRIDHIDPGGGDYQQWKRTEVGKTGGKGYNEIKQQYLSGRRPVWSDADYQE